MKKYVTRDLRQSHFARIGRSEDSLDDGVASSVGSTLPEVSTVSSFNLNEPSALGGDISDWVEEMWASKRKTDIVNRMNEEDVKNALAAWSVNRARVEEEITRRQESRRQATYSSQRRVVLRKSSVEETNSRLNSSGTGPSSSEQRLGPNGTRTVTPTMVSAVPKRVTFI
jgi:hypothetical protein